MARIEIVQATEAHIWPIACTMRQSDRAEVWAWSHETPRSALRQAMDESALAWTGMLDEQPACMFGVTPYRRGIGRPWFLGSTLLDTIPYTFAVLSREQVGRMHDFAPRLENWTDARNVEAHRWLEWLGFTLGEPQMVGVDGALFRPFWKETTA